MQDILTDIAVSTISIFLATFLYDITRCAVIPAWNASAFKIPETIKQADEIVEPSNIISDEPKMVLEDTKAILMVDSLKTDEPDLLQLLKIPVAVAVPLTKAKIKKLRKQELMDELLKIGIEPQAKLEAMRSQLMEKCCK